MSKLAKALTAAAGNAGESLYVEDVFSTYLYTGTGSALTITNGIDLDGEGGLVWIKGRSGATGILNWDTTMSPYNNLSTYNTDAIIDQTSPFGIASANTDGFSIGNTNWSRVNASGSTYASWTFRKAEKFFDVVTFTQTGSSGTFTTFNHNLGSAPGMVLLKATSASYPWFPCYHRSLGNDQYLVLDQTSAAGTSANTFSVNSTSVTVNNNLMYGNGTTYVAYLFAHDAGGFGDDGTENVISCGSFDIDGVGNATVNLGYEPQFVIIKSVEASSNWAMFDNMRGMPVSGTVAQLFPNTSGAEGQASDYIVRPTATGFVATATGFTGSSVNGFIYIAIRRPMKTPESGTEVFAVDAYTGTGGSKTLTTNFVVDAGLSADRGNGEDRRLASRLTGSKFLKTNNTETEGSSTYGFDSNESYTIPWNISGRSYVDYAFKRATGFFDVVAYTGTGSNTSINHNLGVAPELMIVKRRNSARVWAVWASGIDIDDYLTLNGSAGVATFSLWQSTLPTATQITLGTDASVNGSGDTYIGYLFATLAGVSKVGSYTGNGTIQTIDCGFSGGARFILIKSTSTTGSWWVYDSARGIVAGNDPALQLNSTAAEITSADAIDPDSSGFIVNQEATCSINASGVSYIFMSIA